jgi:hypothetical protein
MTTTDECQARLKKLRELALETAKLGAQVFEDAIAGMQGPHPPTPAPKPAPLPGNPNVKGTMGGAVPITPQPKAIIRIIEGSIEIVGGVDCLEKEC